MMTDDLDDSRDETHVGSTFTLFVEYYPEFVLHSSWHNNGKLIWFYVG